MAEDVESGEFGLIRALRRRFPPGEGVEVGLGDDAAVVRLTGAAVLTTDMLVEGVHFDPSVSSATDVGFKSVACNASDIAAMGARPLYALVSLAVPSSLPLAPEGIADGVAQAAEEFGLQIVGGDTVFGPVTTVNVALVGEPGRSGPVLRSTARAGDLLCVTGTLGAASAGLALLRASTPEAVSVLERHPHLAEAHRRGRARVREGVLAAGLATAMIDVSDGAGADAGHIAEESGLGLALRVENLPVAPGVAEAAAALGADAWVFAASGGEDYELLIAVSPHDVGDLRDMLAPVQVTVVGEFRAGAGRFARMPAGDEVPLRDLGWDHFR